MSQPTSGTILSGISADYRLVKRLGTGGHGIAWRATVINVHKKKYGITSGQQVVIKFPKLDPQLPIQRVLDRWNKLADEIVMEQLTSTALRRLRCVAHIVDLVAYKVQFGPRAAIYVNLLVQELREGTPFHALMAARNGKHFHGVATAREFFDWARKLVDLVAKVHGAQVVHGDIWPPNIIVGPRNRLALIDFGQAKFRNLVLRPNAPGNRWVPVGKAGTISGDIDGIGGTLLYLATGRDINKPVPRFDGDDQMKQLVVKEMNSNNRRLNEENWGIADIIASCLRFRPESCPKNTLRLRINIEAFDHLSHQKLLPSFEEQTGSHLFGWLSSCRQRQLNDEIRDMRRSVFDLTGDHDDLVLGMTQFISVLNAGDEYLTITTPLLWRSHNLGISGRFLSMNRLAAQRGATIRRVFLVSSADHKNSETQNILRAHRFLMRSMPKRVQTKHHELDQGGFYTGIVQIGEAERRRLVEMGDHSGVVIKHTHSHRMDGVLMAPVYDKTGLLISIQMRRDARLVRACRARVLEFLDRSSPL